MGKKYEPGTTYWIAVRSELIELGLNPDKANELIVYANEADNPCGIYQYKPDATAKRILDFKKAQELMDELFKDLKNTKNGL